MSASITILNRLFWPQLYGGLERVLWNVSNSFAASSINVRVHCERNPDAPDQQMVRPGLTIHRHQPVEFGRLWRIAELVQVRWWKRVIAQAPESDWYWASEPTAATAVIRAGLGHKLFYRPVFCYDGLTHVARTIPEMAPLGRSYLARKLDRYAYKHAAAVIQQSHNIRYQHEHWYGPRPGAQVISNATALAKPANNTRERFGLSPRHFVVGFVGRPGDPCKDLPFLIRALKAQPIPDHLHLLMVGGGGGFDQAQQWVKDAGLAPRTIWTGNLSDPAPAYAAMDTLVLPSRLETFGNVIAEAHAHGRPAVARVGDFSEATPVFTASSDLIEDGVTGFLVDPHDPSDLGAALVQMAGDPAMAKEMGAVARERAASYTWEDAADRYLQAMGLDRPASLPLRQAA
ncbi:MAG: glycosyltransferase family 4 protein [Phycisphaeraceae bacterium]